MSLGTPLVPRPSTKIRTNWIKFSDELKLLDTNTYMNENDLNEIVNKLMKDLEHTRKITSREYPDTREYVPIKPWITSYVLDQMRKRDKYWQRLRGDPRNPTLRQQYKKLRNLRPTHANNCEMPRTNISDVR